MWVHVSLRTLNDMLSELVWYYLQSEASADVLLYSMLWIDSRVPVKDQFCVHKVSPLGSHLNIPALGALLYNGFF